MDENHACSRGYSNSIDVIAAWKAIEIAMVCVSPTFTRRLTMSLVMAKLKECLRLNYLKGRAVRVNQSIHVKWST
ncbi:lrr receptor-like serine/threonine-protein kinase ios1 [Quercus suber]|uniref:Lrr receptor-like serine/threonine-protein kinase ios1 n=1 Tax=Quercus suber TaxID=58331 RepID=A0AAW0JAN7_QUESU